MPQTAIIKKGSVGPYPLDDFIDVELVSMELPVGSWVLFGRVYIRNDDSDAQGAIARLVAHSDIEVELVRQTLWEDESTCLYLQAALALRGATPIRLLANSYKAYFTSPSLVAMSVDDVEGDRVIVPY